MANGGTFDKNDPNIAAHKTLPFCTELLLTNPANEQTQTVVIRDRGPYPPGRDIDVSEAAAKVLGIKEAGVAKLIVTKIREPERSCPRETG